MELVILISSLMFCQFTHSCADSPDQKQPSSLHVNAIVKAVITAFLVAYQIKCHY